MAFAYLDLETVRQEQEQTIMECFWKMHYRGIESIFLHTHWTPEIDQWLTAFRTKYPGSPLCLFQDECTSLLNRLLKRYPSDWKLNCVKSSLERSDLESKRYGQSALVKTLLLDRDEAIRQSVASLNDPRAIAFSSLREVADCMDLPDEALAESDRAIADYRVKPGLDDIPPEA